MRTILVAALALLTLVVLTQTSPTIAAQTPSAQTVPIPGSATLESGQSVTFRRPSDGATLTVTYRGPERAMVRSDGALTVSVPPLTSNLFLSVRGAAGCVPLTDRSNVRCEVQPAAGGVNVFVSVLNAHPPVALLSPPPGFVIVPLAAGCTNLAVAFPDGTSVDELHDAVHAAANSGARVTSVWRYDAARGRFLGWSPFSGAPNDFERVNRLDTVFVCTTAPGQLVQPAGR